MPKDSGKYTVLLFRSALQESGKITEELKSADLEVWESTDFKEAVKGIAEHQPDLILLQISKKEKGKQPDLGKLKRHASGKQIPCLFLFPAGEALDFEQDLKGISADFITSPYDSQELILRIRRLILEVKNEQAICRQNEELKRTLEARDRLFSVIAHDLRAPIGTIKMINSSIESQKEDIGDPKILKLFGMIQDTTEEAFNLLENLLRWTRNQNGKTTVYATDFNIVAAVRRVVGLFSSVASAKEISIYNHVQENCYVYADEDMVKTVLRNLLSNAIKFTYPGGWVEIGLSDSEGKALVSVKDNGKGIPSCLQAKLLKSEEYITTYGTHNEKGSGLGLVLSRDFIKMNKGKLWFSSQEGVGTTFYFTLPKAQKYHQEPVERR